MIDNLRQSDPMANEGDPCQWYCRRRGQMGSQTIGPMTTAELVKLMERHVLGDQDLVRVGAEGEWLKLSEVRVALEESRAPEDGFDAILSQAESAPVPADASPVITRAIQQHEEAELQNEPAEVEMPCRGAAQAAADVLSHARASMLLPGNEGASMPSQRRLGGVFAVLALAEVLLGAVVWFLGHALRPLRWRSVQLLAGMSLIGLFVVEVVLPRLPLSASETYSEYDALLSRMRAAQDAKADAAEWSRLEEDVRASVSRTADRLRNHAGHMRPDLQELAAVGHLLPDAADETRAGRPGRARAKIEIHMAKAEQLIARHAELAAKQGPDAHWLFSDDLVFWLIGVADVLLVLWILRGVLTGTWGLRHQRA